jgi:uncharacterized membrane protein YkgB
MMRAPGPHPPIRLTTEDKIAICVGAIALIAGILVLALASGTLATYVGGGLFGVAGIDIVSLAFLLIGESEDRDIAGKHRVSRPD